MATRAVTLATLCLLAFTSASAHETASARARASFGAIARRNVLGDEVVIRLQNATDHSVRMGRTWTITAAADGSESSVYVWPDGERTVAAGESRIWMWDQYTHCNGVCQNVSEGEQVPPGRYRVTATVDGVTRTDGFVIGQYFTLGFDGEPDVDFEVFVADPTAYDKMHADAAAPRDQRDLIVSGIVRGPASYNPRWSYTMGPRTIVADEAFTEVCDATPGYVEQHRRAWMGQRWCPWTSYVASEGAR
ncbi:MAG TPA: hypothetical protein VFK89_07365 [Actinomycetota bacterium]|nr:hypothetical protein [Actinomycetota bacterium]